MPMREEIGIKPQHGKTGTDECRSNVHTSARAHTAAVTLSVDSVEHKVVRASDMVRFNRL
jgi:hypothetical protein